MNDEFNFTQMPAWLASEMQFRGLYRLSQIIYMSEDQLRENRVMTVGMIRNLSIYLEERNIFFKNGENSITRLHLHKNGLWMLINHGITELSDLENYTKYELAYEIGFGSERAEFISRQMNRWGHRLKAA